LCRNAEQATANCYVNSATYVCVKLNISCDNVSSSVWMDGLIEGCFDGWMDEWMVWWMGELLVEWMSRRMDGW